MRYLSSISLALIAHVLLSIVGLMILACTATPAEPTPSSPMYSEEEAIAVLKEHLQAKPVPRARQGVTCFTQIGSVTWSAKYDNEGRRWDVKGEVSEGGAWAESRFATLAHLTALEQLERLLEDAKTPEPLKYYTWSVYERTKSIVATGDEWLNQVC
jgi:hypothetical protein